MNAQFPEADVYALDCIRVGARRLVAQKLVQNDEVEDVCNNVYCEFLKRRNRFNPARGSYRTFTSTVVRNLIASEARTRIESRSHSFTFYANTATNGTFADFTRSTVDTIDLHIAVRQAIDTLPVPLKCVANAMFTETITEISERTGKARSTLYEQRAEIRSHFERLGLRLG